MTKVRFTIVDEHELAPYCEGLRALECSISYPIEDGADRFVIDHGVSYHPFFTRMGKARFLLALADEQVVGSIAGVWRKANFFNRIYTGLYICDLKIAPTWRGRGLVQKMLWHALLRWPITPDFYGWRFLYFAAMQGGTGDVTNSFRGWHLGHLLKPISQQILYFISPEKLTILPDGGPSAPQGRGLNLSCDNALVIESTTGFKDFRLQSTGKPWPLVHLPQSPLYWQEDCASYLRNCGQQMMEQYSHSLACFGVDQRLTNIIQWFDRVGIERGARCVLYGFSLPGFAPAMRRFDWVHLATSDI